MQPSSILEHLLGDVSLKLWDATAQEEKKLFQAADDKITAMQLGGGCFVGSLSSWRVEVSFVQEWHQRGTFTMFYPPVRHFESHTATIRKKAKAAGKGQSLLEIFQPQWPHDDPWTCAKRTRRQMSNRQVTYGKRSTQRPRNLRAMSHHSTCPWGQELDSTTKALAQVAYRNWPWRGELNSWPP